MTYSDTFESLVKFNVRGTKFSILDPGNTVAAETFCELGYEPAVVDLLDRVNARYPKAVFFDIGALHGYYSALVFSRYEGWQVVAFEPNPEAFAVLRQNFETLGIKGDARQQALNDAGDDLHFKGRTIVESGTPDAIVVPGTQFDELHIDFEAPAKIVKIDVHGAEGLVLAGMENAIRHDIAAVLIEVHAQHLLVGEHTYAQILDMLEANGLDVFEVEEFRYSDTATLVPIAGDRRDQFVDYTRWTEEQVSRERLIYAQRTGEVLS